MSTSERAETGDLPRPRWRAGHWVAVGAALVVGAVMVTPAEYRFMGAVLGVSAGVILAGVWLALVGRLRCFLAEIAAGRRKPRPRWRGIMASVLLTVVGLAAAVACLVLTSVYEEDDKVIGWSLAAGAVAILLPAGLTSMWQAARARSEYFIQRLSYGTIACSLGVYFIVWLLIAFWVGGSDLFPHGAIVAWLYVVGQLVALVWLRRFCVAGDVVAVPLASVGALASIRWSETIVRGTAGWYWMGPRDFEIALITLGAFLLALSAGHVAVLAFRAGAAIVSRLAPSLRPFLARFSLGSVAVKWCAVPAPATIADRVKRPFQFRLRTLLVATAVLGVVSGWVGSCLGRFRLERRAVEAIQEMGGEVWFAEWHPRILPGNRLSRLTESVRQWLGDVGDVPFFARGANVTMPPTAGDDELRHIEHLPHLDKLDLSHTQVTDAGLTHLEGAAKLEILWLASTAITDAGIEDIARHTELQALDLSGTQITDAGLARLHTLTDLQSINLFSTQISDAGLAQLENLSALRVVYLRGTKVTPAGVQKLQSALTEANVVWSPPRHPVEAGGPAGP